PARRDATLPARTVQPAAGGEAAFSWQLPRGDLHGKLIVAVVEKADAHASVGVSRHDSRRGVSDQLPSFRQHDHIALDAEGAIENELPILEEVRRGIGVGLENADARLATLRHGAGKMDFDEAPFFGGDFFELQILARREVDDALPGGNRAGAN